MNVLSSAKDYGQLNSPVSPASPDPFAAQGYVAGSAGAAAAPAARSDSALAVRRKSQEGLSHLSAPERKEAPHAGGSGARAVGWEPVSPGMLDRNPEAMANRPTGKYNWPSSDEAAKAQAKSNPASSSSSSAAALGAGSRRSSKAAELQFPVDGLDGGLLTMSNAEYRALLVSALRSHDLSTSRAMVTAPLPRSVGVVRCLIKRSKSGLLQSLFPVYECYLEDGQAPVFLMSSKKRTKNKSSNYTISLLSADMLAKSSADAAMTSEDPNYLGKLRSNFSGSEFVGYDAGINPKSLMAATSGSGSSGSGPLSWLKGSRRPSEAKIQNVREELCAIQYETNILSRCPRKFRVVIPGMLAEDPSKRIVCRPLVPSDSLLYQYQQLAASDADKAPKLHEEQLEYKEIQVLHNKEPVWEEQVGAYCLNFHGRATIASVKNFQLINVKGNQNLNSILLQFGKIDKDVFTMDVQYPMSLLQAFEISLAGLDTKLICD